MDEAALPMLPVDLAGREGLRHAPADFRRRQVANVEPAHHVWRFNQGISESRMRNRRHTLTRHTLTSSHAYSPPRLLFPTLFSSFQCNGSRRSPL